MCTCCDPNTCSRAHGSGHVVVVVAVVVVVGCDAVRAPPAGAYNPTRGPCGGARLLVQTYSFRLPTFRKRFAPFLNASFYSFASWLRRLDRKSRAQQKPRFLTSLTKYEKSKKQQHSVTTANNSNNSNSSNKKQQRWQHETNFLLLILPSGIHARRHEYPTPSNVG